MPYQIIKTLFSIDNNINHFNSSCFFLILISSLLLWLLVKCNSIHLTHNINPTTCSNNFNITVLPTITPLSFQLFLPFQLPIHYLYHYHRLLFSHKSLMPMTFQYFITSIAARTITFVSFISSIPSWVRCCPPCLACTLFIINV